MKWMAALKIYNHNKGKWCIPKKGTTEYAKVKEIMNNGTASVKKKAAPVATVNVAHAMAQNQVRRGKLFNSFEARMRAMDLAKKLRGMRTD